MELYVYARSKKALNERLARGEPVYGYEYKPGRVNPIPLASAPDRTTLKLYEKSIGGNPYAKAYGVWNAKKKRAD